MTESTKRVVAITGAGTGIGQATAVKFAERGHTVVVGGRRVEKLEETRALIEKVGGRCLPLALDVSDGASVDDFFDAAEAEVGTIGTVINNAAMARYGPLEDFSPEEIQKEVATKLLGSLFMARRAIPRMRVAERGDILFISSVSSVNPWPFHLPYTSANAAVEQAAKTLRLELEGSGIRVSILRCGETLGTDFSTKEQESGRMGPYQDLWFRRGLLRHNGLMNPDMVADAVVHTVSLPEGMQYETVAVIPTAPVGPLPTNIDEFYEGMARYFT